MFIEQKKLQGASEYKKLAPITAELHQIKTQFDTQLKQNLIFRERFVVVCGPCSADDPAAMEEYLLKLKNIADDCPNLFVVARIYTSKPHSNGQGYKGSAFHVRNDDAIDIDSGILRCRQMMLKCLELGLPVADELLYPELYECFDDLVSYWFVGARSSEDNMHRDLASGLDVCCGVKNATDGNVEKVTDSLFAVSNPCVFPYKGAQIATSGCKYAHIVLRGGVNEGVFTSNISVNDVICARNLLNQQGLNNFVMADLNHANSGKIAVKQIENAKIALDAGVDGIMIESYLNAGGRSTAFGASQTDDCLSFEDTKQLLLYIQDIKEKS